PLLAQVIGGWKPGRHAARLLERALERRVVGRKIRQRAMLVALRNVRARQAIVSGLLAPALAANDAAHTGDLDRLPVRVVAVRTGHRVDSTSTSRAEIYF